jgi:tetratricopeptide (TPR) repeat protein
VEALREDLAAWRERRPLRALPDTARYRFAKFIVRHRAGALLALAALVGAAAFTWRLAAERDRALAAERLAEQNLRNTVLTQRFLAGTLMGAGARDENGQPVSGVALIERAAQSLERDLGGEPRALAEVASLVAQAWMNATVFQRAVDAARLAVERTPADERPVVRASRLRLLARNLASLGHLDEAAATARDGIALLPDPPPDREHAEAGAQLRVTLARAIDAGDAQLRAVREDLLRYARAHLPRGHQLRGMAASLWASVLEVEDRIAELPAARREALDEWAADPGAFPTDLAYQELNLARALRLAGRLDEATNAAQAAEGRFAAALGERMISGRAMVLVEQAAIDLERGDATAARGRFGRYRALAPGLGLDDDALALAVGASLLAADGRLAEARTAAERAAARATTPSERRFAQAIGDRLAAR